MPGHALTEPPTGTSADPVPAGSAIGRFARRHPWLLTAVGLLVLAAVLTKLANTRPGYDPYGWLDWGQLTIHGKLDTNGAPSWKPLPYLFTVPFALFGRHGALWLWMVFSVAVSLSGGIFAWRIAWRLVDPPAEQRYAGYAAGTFAVIGLFGIVDYAHYVFSYQSDPMIVALCLAAIDGWLRGRHRRALACWWLGSLGRPEVWPFLFAHSVWCWRREDGMKGLVGGAWVSLALLWYGIPAVSSRSPFVSQDNALNSPRIIHGNKITGTIRRFTHQQTWPLELLGVAGFARAAWRRSVARNLPALLIGIGALVWLLVEIAFALHGFPAVPRYMFEPVAIMGVMGGVAIGRSLLDGPDLIRRAFPAASLRAGTATLGAGVIVFGAALLPVARARYDAEHIDLRHERARTTEINKLMGVMDVLGVDHILSCGVPRMPVEYQSIFAYHADIKTTIMYVTRANLHRKGTLVDMYPVSSGWHVFPDRVTPQKAPVCHHLRVLYTG